MTLHFSVHFMWNSRACKIYPDVAQAALKWTTVLINKVITYRALDVITLSGAGDRTGAGLPPTMLSVVSFTPWLALVLRAFCVVFLLFLPNGLYWNLFWCLSPSKVHTDWVIMYLNRYRFRQEKFSVQVYKPLAGSKEGMEGKNWLYLFHCA